MSHPISVNRCYYDILQVERSASSEEIRKSYRKLALQLHPGAYKIFLDIRLLDYALLDILPDIIYIFSLKIAPNSYFVFQ